MKVLAVNSSPRKEGISRTRVLLTHLVEGMQDGGADVEVIHLREKEIKNCIACLSCWAKTPGECVHQDDMSKELLPKWQHSDLVVYATPVHYHTTSALMKTFIDRMFPSFLPFFEKRSEGWNHPTRDRIPPAAVVLAVCAFPEDSAFEILSHYMHHLFHGKRIKLVAEIYRNGSQLMTKPPWKDKFDDILAATTQAGREIVTSMEVSPETMTRIKQPLLDKPDSYFEIANLAWEVMIEKKILPEVWDSRTTMPRPDSLKTFMFLMKLGFNPRNADNTKAVLQFEFSGEVEGICHFLIEQGAIKAVKGRAEAPDLTIKTPFELWMDMRAGVVDRQQMFQQGKFQVEGDMALLGKMRQLFGR